LLALDKAALEAQLNGMRAMVERKRCPQLWQGPPFPDSDDEEDEEEVDSNVSCYDFWQGGAAVWLSDATSDEPYGDEDPQRVEIRRSIRHSVRGTAAELFLRRFFRWFPIQEEEDEDYRARRGLPGHFLDISWTCPGHS